MKYSFNEETLTYSKIEKTHKKAIKKILLLFGISLILAITSITFFSQYFETPKKYLLEKRNVKLIEEFKQINQELDVSSNQLSAIQKRDDDCYRVYSEIKPIPATVRQAGFGGVNRYEKLEGYENSDLLIETAKKSDEIFKQIYIQSKSFDEVFSIIKRKEKRFACVPAIQPVSYKQLRRISAVYGMRSHPIFKTKRMHHGIDFAAPVGSNIHAPGDGKVILVKKSNKGYGNELIIDHGFGYKTLYAHLYKIHVKKGQEVKRGEIVAEVGSTGLSTGPHLHYEVRFLNKPLNPAKFFVNDLTNEEYERVCSIK
ncbi:MAG: M23 family metallopeptidase [Bacteroidales bacterium]|nr:M23 family metallopeptidase [Bacteroidales bacterium]